MQEEIYKTLGKKRKKFYKSMPVALQFEDPEDVHQLRVAGRTVLALLDLLADEDDLADARFKKMRGSLKKAMGLLGQAQGRGRDDRRDRAAAPCHDAGAARSPGLLARRAAGRAARSSGGRSPGSCRRSSMQRWKKRMARWQRTKASSPADRVDLPPEAGRAPGVPGAGIPGHPGKPGRGRSASITRNCWTGSTTAASRRRNCAMPWRPWHLSPMWTKKRSGA